MAGVETLIRDLRLRRGRERRGLALAEGVRLDSYAADQQAVGAGADLCVVLNWRATAPVGEPYAVFVHLLGSAYNAGSGNYLWGQHDGQPADGTRPLTGWLAASGDISAFASGMTTLLQDPEMARGLGHASRRYVGENCRWSIVAERCEALYRRMIEARK